MLLDNDLNEIEAYYYELDEKNIEYSRLFIESEIEKTKDFAKPVERLKNGAFKMKPGMVYIFAPRAFASSAK